MLAGRNTYKDPARGMWGILNENDVVENEKDRAFIFVLKERA